MSFVALVSGGKDSIFALHACITLGYKLEAIGHIRPYDVKNETDSYMYQSVGSTFLEPIAECLNVPLFVHELKYDSRAKCTSLDYATTADDEVEALFTLLTTIKERFPDVKFVSSGAILSDYQRNRVESVYVRLKITDCFRCNRLSLLSLAFLWKFQQTTLLDLMVETPCFDAIVVKVASMGLGSSDVGRSLKTLAPKLHALSKKFGIHACGEGGEFETVVINSSLFLKNRIEIPKFKQIIHHNDPIAPSIYVCPESPIKLESKSSFVEPSNKLFNSQPSLEWFGRIKSVEFYFLDVLGTSLQEFKSSLANVDYSSVPSKQSTSWEFDDNHLVVTSQMLTWNSWELNLMKSNKPEMSFTTPVPDCIKVHVRIERIMNSNQNSSKSFNVWRASNFNSFDFIVLSNCVVVTNWQFGMIPHSRRIPVELCREVSAIAQLCLAFRNARNCLLDAGASLYSSLIINAAIDEKALDSITGPIGAYHLIANLWCRNYGNDIDCNEKCIKRTNALWKESFSQEDGQQQIRSSSFPIINIQRIHGPFEEEGFVCCLQIIAQKKY